MVLNLIKPILTSVYHFFPAVIVAHLAGQLYKLIVAKHGGFSTQMSVSGPASSTGKSLMQTVGMLLFYGEVQPTTTSITESTFYDMLEDGNIYGKIIARRRPAEKKAALFTQLERFPT